jgi:hypothetical protein
MTFPKSSESFSTSAQTSLFGSTTLLELPLMVSKGRSKATLQSIQDICDILDEVLSIIEDDTKLPKKITI